MKSTDSLHLFHFTSSYKAIAGILSDKGFRLKYCKEEFSFGKKRISTAVHAMVSFSSYFQHELIDAPITYGRYGICLTEEWAHRMKVHEVLYMERNSRPAKALATLLEARQGKRGEFPDTLRLPVMQIRCFVKNAKGPNAKAGNNQFNFRSEREWRFIPSNTEIGGARFSENQSRYKEHRDKMNAEVWNYKLGFTSKDIVRIYVDTEAEISQLSGHTGIKSNLFKISPWKCVEFKPTKGND